MGVRVNKGIPVETTYPSVMTFAPNASVAFNLTTSDLVEQFDIQLSGTLTLAGYTEAPTIRAESIENLISQIRFNGNAKQNGAQAVTFSAVDAAYLRFKTGLVSGTTPTRVGVDSANGAYAFSSTFSKYFGAKGLNKIYDATYVDTRLLQTFAMLFQCRDVNAMVVPGSGTDGTATLTNVQATIHQTSWQSGAIAVSAPYIKETQRSLDLSVLGSGLDRDFLNMPIGNIITRQTYKGCVTPNSDGVDYADPSDAFFTTNLRPEGAHVKTTITGSGGTKTPNDITYAHLQAQNKAKNSLEAWPIGYATVMYARNGNINNALNLSGASILSAKNTFDLTAVAGNTNTLWITDEEIVSN